jgi:hypothetical protein
MKNINFTQLSKLSLLATIFVAINLNVFAGMETATRPGMTHAGFIKNAGQVYDMNGKLCPDVLYSLQLNGMAVFITQKGFTYCMVRLKETSDSEKKDYSKRKVSEPIIYDKVARLDMNLLNAEIKKENCMEEIADDSRGVINYYGGGLNQSALNLHYITQLRILNRSLCKTFLKENNAPLNHK